MEELHGHDWRVTVVVAGPDLDSEDLLVDFHAVEAALQSVVAPFSVFVSVCAPCVDVAP